VTATATHSELQHIGQKTFNSFNGTCSLITSHQKNQTRASSNICFLETTFTHHLASYFITKEYNYHHSIYILVVLQEEAEMWGKICVCVYIYIYTHTHIICHKVTGARKLCCLFMSATMTDQCTLKYATCFTGVTDIYLHSPNITNGITSLKTTYKK